MLIPLSRGERRRIVMCPHATIRLILQGTRHGTDAVKTRSNLLVLFALPFLSVSACSPEQVTNEPEISRDTVRQIIRRGQEILTPRGIHDLREIEVGGIGQWISVRGRDRRNPILLFIHGGPGTTEMPVSWFYQVPLEDYFVVVQWDQRGSGKTAVSNDQPAVISTITFERMAKDAEEIVSYLRREYDKDKVFVLGHSWGSLLGLELAQRRPRWLHAYVGMGQVIYTLENEAVGYRYVLAEARRRNDQTAIHELEAIAPYPKEDGSISVEDVLIQRKWVSAYGGMAWGRPNLDYETSLRLLSPDYSDADLAADIEAINVVMQLLPQLNDVDYRSLKKLELPIFLFSGRHDYAVPSEVSSTWFEELEAPEKRIFWFEHSAHMIQFEQPGKFVRHLVEDIRPLAVEVGDAAPDDEPGTRPH